MGRLIGRKALQLVPVLLIVTFFSFLLITLLPGDPAQTIIPFGTDADRAALRHDLHLDDPFLVQYGKWVGGLAQGDLGRFYDTKQPVSDALSHALPVSLLLMLYAQVLSLVIAVPLGIATAYRAGSRFDRGANATAFGLLAIPNFVVALVLAYLLGVKAKWFPVLGYTKFADDPVAHVKSMALPAISLAVGQLAIYMRLLRSDMIATLREDYIAMARSRGLPTRRILLRHALKPSSLTLLTVAGVNVGQLIGGAVIVETIFQLPGMGLLTVQAILSRQYVVVQSVVAVIAIGYVLVNFVVDVLYSVLDPRTRVRTT